MKFTRSFFSDLLFFSLGILLLLFFFILYNRINSLNNSFAAVTHTNLVKLRLEETVSTLKDAETGQRGFLITRDSLFLSPNQKSPLQLKKYFNELDSLLSDNPEQRQNLARLSSITAARLDLLSATLTMGLENKNVIPFLRQGNVLMDSIRMQVNTMTATEDSLLNQRSKTQQHHTLTVPWYTITLFCLTLCILLFSFYKVQLELREQQKLKKELQQSKTFLESLLDSSHEVILAMDDKLRYTLVNKSMEKHLNIRREDVLGKKLTDVYPEVKGTEDLNLVQEVLTGNHDLSHVLKSSILGKHFEVNMVPLRSASGTVGGILIVGRDLTPLFQKTNELEKANEALLTEKAFAELLIESSPDMIYAYDNHLHFTVWNKKSEEHTGLAKEEVLGRHALDVFPGYNNDEWKTAINEVLAGKSVHLPKIKFLHRQGYGESFIIPLKKPDGEIFGVLSITRNISDLVNTTETLERKNEELEQSNQELASFSYIASHDLQEPLRKIQGFAGRIMDKQGDQFSLVTKDYFNRIVSAAGRMQSLIDSLLNFSRTNTADLTFESTDLNMIMEDVKNNLKETIEEKKAVIEFSPLPVLHVVAVQFHQLFLNLLSNALKYSKAHITPHIKIRVDIVNGEGLEKSGGHAEKNYWKISMEDNGIGFEQQYEHKIFELFQRLHGKIEYSGTGIGLAICKKIVQKHNGFMTAQGQPGIGSVFSIYLPLISD